MCGICGVVGWGSVASASREQRVRAMLWALAHRGPDTCGTRADGTALLGATRLAIRGLGEEGRQPIVDDASGVMAVCNGEIDNHRELRDWLKQRGHSPAAGTDVAVIPALYAELGDAFVERLAGAFALAVWDPRTQTLLLARDRAGEHPLFFARRAGELTFATEVAALVAAAQPLTVDREALAGYLARGVFLSPGTPFRELRKIGPGEVVTIDERGVRHRRYWRWSIVAGAGKTADLGALDAALHHAVTRQSDVDVDYGVFLSGGMDSALVAAVARRVRPRHRLRAYTLRFAESSFDEGSSANQVAALLGLDSAAVWIEPDDLARELPVLLAAVGEPLADPAWVPTSMLARRAAKDVPMVLVGEGADELFGGYPTYPGALLAERYERLPAGVRAVCRRVLAAWPPSERKVPLSFLLRRFTEHAGEEALARHVAWTATLPDALLLRLGVQPPPAVPAYEGAHLLDRLQLFDFETSLAEGLLTKADRAGMAFALELRAPFLDREVLEVATTLAPEDRVRGLGTKVLLKRLARRYLPREVVDRRKRGLSVPLARWLRGPLFSWARQRFEGDLLADAGIDSRVPLALLDEHRERRADFGRPLWALLVLNEWLAWLRGQPVGAPAEPAAWATPRR